MEWSAMIPLAFGVGLALGAGFVGLLKRRSGGAARERAQQLAGELDEAREELERQRAEVAKHFEETSDLFRDLTEQYGRLYAHLSQGAREFCTAEVPALGRGLGDPLLQVGGDPRARDDAQTQADAQAEEDAQPSGGEAQARRSNGSGSEAVA